MIGLMKVEFKLNVCVRNGCRFNGIIMIFMKIYYVYIMKKKVFYIIYFLKCLNVKKLKLNEFILRGEIYFFIFIFGCYYFLNCIIYLKF